MTSSQNSIDTEYGMLLEKPPEQQDERSPVAPSRLDVLWAKYQDNPASGNAHVPFHPRPETRLLEMIRDNILCVLGAETEDAEDVDLFITWPLLFSWDNNRTTSLEPDTERSSETGIAIALARPVIREAWPQDYNVHGVCQCIVESDDNLPAIEVPWDDTLRHALEDLWHRWCLESHQGNVQDCYDTVASRIKYRGKIVYCSLGSCRRGVRRVPLGVFATALSNDAPFSILGSKIVQADVGWSARLFYPRFQSQCTVLPEAFEVSSIHWQIRYIRPALDINGYRGFETSLFLSDRERTNIRVGAEGTLLEERRAWITLRVKKTNLFHILILSDESFDPSSEDTHHLNSQRQAGRSWSRYGLKAAENTITVCQFLLEVCRIFDEAMDAWERTLNVIDELVHVNLSDGLFNATALREATKAAKLNQAIYIFTIVTLVFTPLGFLATWWALPFLNEPVDESGKVPKPSGFLSSFIVMPLLTSAVAVGLARYTGQESHHYTLLVLGQIKTMWDKLLQSLQHLWDRRPQLPEREKGPVRSRSLSLGY